MKQIVTSFGWLVLMDNGKWSSQVVSCDFFEVFDELIHFSNVVLQELGVAVNFSANLLKLGLAVKFWRFAHWHPINHHFFFGFVVLSGDGVLHAWVVGGTLFIEEINEEHVVPQEVLAVDVVLEGDTLLLEGLSGNVANVAIVFLIVHQFVVLLSECSEGVEHDTRNDIAEKNAEEDAVDHIVWETHDLELLHRLPYGSGDE